MKKKALIPILVITVIGSMVVCSLALNFAMRIAGAKIPEPQVVSRAENICIAFMPNRGSGEYIEMFTYWCGSSADDMSHIKDVYEEEQYLHKVVTMECPVIRLRDDDSDGRKEIYIKQDKLCKEFAHPWVEDPEELSFIVTEGGRFIEADLSN